MKKILGILLTATVFFTSCEFVSKEELRKPDVTLSGSGITLSIAVYNDSKYANIYRREIIKNGDDIEYGTVMNIGEIIPTTSNNKDSYGFPDLYIVSGKMYSYCVRYTRKNGYVYTGWTEWPVDENKDDVTPPTTTFADDDALKMSIPDGVYLKYDKNFKTLQLVGGDISQVTGFESFLPCICVSYKNVSKVFQLENISAGDDLTEGFKIDPKSFLSGDFFNQPITFDGFLYQKSDTTDLSYEKVYWSQLAVITVKDDSGEVVESVTIPSVENDDNYHDFTDLDGSATGTTASSPSVFLRNVNYPQFSE